MCYMTRQLLPSPSEGALIHARGGRGQPSAPHPVLAAERIPEHSETGLTTGPTPCPLRAPLWVILRGASQRFSATPSKRDVLGAGATVGAGERRQPVYPRTRRGKRVCLGGVLLEGLLGELFNSSASRKRKKEKLY